MLVILKVSIYTDNYFCQVTFFLDNEKKAARKLKPAIIRHAYIIPASGINKIVTINAPNAEPIRSILYTFADILDIRSFCRIVAMEKLSPTM